jgi:ubiquinone/menaquinone biosynthesis C-methylase UbiE
VSGDSAFVAGFRRSFFVKMKDLYRTQFETQFQEAGFAESYESRRYADLIWPFYHSIQMGFLNDIILQRKPPNLLEVAVGSARIARNLREVNNAVGIDLTLEMVRLARTKLEQTRWNLLVGNAFHLPFHQASFDSAICIGLLKHFPPLDRKRLYRELCTVLKPGGLLIIDARNRRFMDQNFAKKKNLKSYYHEELANELEQNGFEKVTFRGILYSTSVLRFLRPLNLVYQKYLRPRSRQLNETEQKSPERFLLGVMQRGLLVFDKIFKGSGFQSCFAWVVTAQSRAE